jgi:hypothetical protein
MRNLIKVLEVSEKKHGSDYVLTIGHLLNILKFVEKCRENEEIEKNKQHDKLINEVMNPNS